MSKPTPAGTGGVFLAVFWVPASSIDLRHPSLQTTTTGERTIVDWGLFADPLDGRGQITAGIDYQTIDVVVAADKFTAANGYFVLCVFNCTSASCRLAGQWLVVVDAYAAPAGTTDYNDIDIFTNPVFGSVCVTDSNAARAAGSSWSVPDWLTANGAPAVDCVLLGNVQMRTATCWSARARS